MPTLQETLTHAGFDPTVAEIYLILVNHGEQTVPQILEHTELSRASVYEALPELIAGEYIEYRKEGRQAFYKPTHPQHLTTLLEKKKRDIALLEGELSETIRSLVGAYNLSSNKPGVQFFEGEEGVRETIFDSLTATEPIYTILNLEALKGKIDDINKAYVKARKQKGIHKRILAVDTPANRTYLSQQGQDLTDVRFLPKNIVPFHTAMEIYNNKISYITLRHDSLISVLIEDPDIYRMHRSIFEHLWGQDENTQTHTSVETSSLGEEMKKDLSMPETQD